MARKVKPDQLPEIRELSKEELDELMGINPRRLLDPRSEETLRNWYKNYKRRIPYAPRPWFYVKARNEGVWDGEGLVKSGWAGLTLTPGPNQTVVTDERGKIWFQTRTDKYVSQQPPPPPYYVDADTLALLYASATACLEAAIEASKKTAIHCSVEAYPPEAYAPPSEYVEGEFSWWEDVHEAQHWMDMLISRINKRYYGHIDPTPLESWIRQGVLPEGRFHPESKLCFWSINDIWAAWERVERGRRPKRGHKRCEG